MNHDTDDLKELLEYLEHKLDTEIALYGKTPRSKQGASLEWTTNNIYSNGEVYATLYTVYLTLYNRDYGDLISEKWLLDTPTTLDQSLNRVTVLRKVVKPHGT